MSRRVNRTLYEGDRIFKYYSEGGSVIEVVQRSRTSTIILLLFMLFVPCLAQDQQPTLDLPPRKTFGPAGVRSLDLDEAIKLGLRQNPQMSIAEEQVEQARAQYEQQRSAKGLRLLVNNRTTVQRRRTIETSDLLTGRFPNFPSRFVLLDPVSDNFSLSLQKLLTTFGRVESQTAAAFMQIDVESANASLMAQNLRYDIKKAFLDKLKADALVAAQRSNLAVSRENLNRTQALFDRGITSRYDLLQAQIAVTRAVESLSENLTQVDVASTKLGNVLNDSQERVQPLPPPPVSFDPDLDLDDLRAVAANNRAELVALNYRKEVAQMLLKAAQKSNRPELVLAANYSTALGQSLSPTDVTALTLQLQWTLFDGGLKKSTNQGSGVGLAPDRCQQHQDSQRHRCRGRTSLAPAPAK